MAGGQRGPLRDRRRGQRHVAGSLGLRLVGGASRVAEVGYGLRPAWRGLGHATRGLRLVSGWAFSTSGIVRLELGVAAGNLASQRVAERAGFRREGVARQRLATSGGGRTDEVRYGLLPHADRARVR